MARQKCPACPSEASHPLLVWESESAKFHYTHPVVSFDLRFRAVWLSTTVSRACILGVFVGSSSLSAVALNGNDTIEK
ncbi:unnamed protein product [Jaminaea pallidilutea]